MNIGIPRKWISKEEAIKMFPKENEELHELEKLDTIYEKINLKELNKLYEKIIRMLLNEMHDRNMTIWPKEMIDKEAVKKII